MLMSFHSFQKCSCEVTEEDEIWFSDYLFPKRKCNEITQWEFNTVLSEHHDIMACFDRDLVEKRYLNHHEFCAWFYYFLCDFYVILQYYTKFETAIYVKYTWMISPYIMLQIRDVWTLLWKIQNRGHHKIFFYATYGYKYTLTLSTSLIGVGCTFWSRLYPCLIK